MAKHGLNIQKFRVASSADEAEKLLQGSDAFNFHEYVVKAQVLTGGRGKGYFKNSGMKGGVKLTKDKNEACQFAR